MIALGRGRVTRRERMIFIIKPLCLAFVQSIISLIKKLNNRIRGMLVFNLADILLSHLTTATSCNRHAFKLSVHG